MWKRAWQPAPVFSPGYPHGQRSLAGYSPWNPKELDTTEWLSTAQHRRIWLTHTSPSSSAANEWLDDIGGIEMEVHGRTSQRNVHQKGLIELVLFGFQVRVPRHHHKRWISEPRGYWRLPRNSSAIYTEYAVDFLGSGRPMWDECKWSFRTEVSSSTSLDQQQRSPQELAINPRGEQEEGSPERESKLNVIECCTW